MGSVRLTLDRGRGRAPTPNLLVHAARDGAAGGGLRALTRSLFGLADGRRTVGAAVEFHANAALDLGPRGGHEKKERRHGEHGGERVERGALHGGRVETPAKVGVATTLSTRRRVSHRPPSLSSRGRCLAR